MRETIQQIADSSEMAIVGVSDRDFGGVIYRTLRDRGYSVYAVHPARSSFADDQCYSSLKEVPGKVRVAIIAVAPNTAKMVVEDAKQAGFTHLWFQQGKDFSSAEKAALEAGMKTVSGKCILMYAGKVEGVHAIHRFIAKLFGRY